MTLLNFNHEPPLTIDRLYALYLECDQLHEQRRHDEADDLRRTAGDLERQLLGELADEFHPELEDLLDPYQEEFEARIQDVLREGGAL